MRVRSSILLALSMLAVFPRAAEARSMLWTDAVIWTGDPGKPWAEALWVEDGLLRAVGSEAEVRAAAPAGTPALTLEGAFVCPGLIDAHAHVLGFGLGLSRVDLVGTGSLEETLSRVASGVATAAAEERGGWIEGRGWDQNDWPGDGAFPTAADLDRVSGEYPISLSRIDGHAIWVNTRALELAGITADTPDPPGGRIVRDAAGNPTGVLIDNAERLVEDVIPEPDAATKAAAIRRAADTLLRAGLTGVHDMGMDAADLAVYRELAHEDLGVRVYAAYSATDPRLDEVLAAGPDPAWTNWFRLGMVKFYLDGALGSRGAALLADYSDDPGNRGLLVTDPATFHAVVRRALAAGFQAAVHAIGDRGNRLALDGWDEVVGEGGVAAAPVPAPAAPLSTLGAVPATVPRYRVEHAQVVAVEDLDRFAALGAVASMQPTHCTSDMPWAPLRLGEARLRGAYAWRSMRDRGVILAAGSDFPVESHDPRYGLYAAVTRRGLAEDDPVTGWSPEERLAREEALTTFTATPAYVSGDLHRLGTLTPGKAADLVVFDVNLVTCDPERILDAEVLYTVIDGVVRWRAPGAAALPEPAEAR